jgi:hypothetical protein
MLGNTIIVPSAQKNSDGVEREALNLRQRGVQRIDPAGPVVNAKALGWSRKRDQPQSKE